MRPGPRFVRLPRQERHPDRRVGYRGCSHRSNRLYYWWYPPQLTLESVRKKNAPEIADMDIPIGLIVVFTHSYIVRGKGNNKERRVSGELDLKASTFTAMHVSKVRGYFRSNKFGEPLPKDVYESLQKAFDLKAQHLLESGDEADEKSPEEAA